MKSKSNMKDSDLIVVHIDDHKSDSVQHTVHSTDLQLKHAFAGGLSGALTRAICQPLDMIKIRFQLQVEPLSTNQRSKYRSMPQAFKLIAKEEGIRGLWKGHNPAQVLSIVFGVSQFWCYEELVTLAKNYEVLANHPRMSNFLCGGLSGVVATFAVNPLDVVRTRLIAQDSSKGYRNSLQGIRKIVERDGIKGLYRGVVPALTQTAPLTGANFMFYKLLVEIFQNVAGYKSEKDIPYFGLILMGGFTGVASKTLMYPMDLAKKRLQIQGFGEHRQTFGTHFQCNGLIACMKNTIVEEGVLGLYKGLVPSLLKAGFTTAFHFAFYDEICRIIIKEGET